MIRVGIDEFICAVAKRCLVFYCLHLYRCADFFSFVSIAFMMNLSTIMCLLLRGISLHPVILLFTCAVFCVGLLFQLCNWGCVWDRCIHLRRCQSLGILFCLVLLLCLSVCQPRVSFSLNNVRSVRFKLNGTVWVPLFFIYFVVF